MSCRIWQTGFYDSSDGVRTIDPAELNFRVAESRYYRAVMLSMGLNPDTTLIEDLYLVQRSVDEFGRTVGIQPSKEVTDEFNRCQKWIQKELEKELPADNSPQERARIAREAREAATKAKLQV